MTVTRQTTPKQVIAWYQDHHGTIQYHTALRVLHAIRGDEYEEQSLQFALLPSYASNILLVDPFATSKLKLVGHRFSSLFIAPSFATTAWQHIRPFIAVDAAWTKVIHEYVLLIATGIDGNGRGMNLAWGVAPKENMDHWGWFIDNLALALPGLNTASTVIMSDRQKGLNRAVQIRMPQATEAFCCKHMERNMVQEFGNEVANGFWKAVYARTRVDFNKAMAALKEINPRSVSCHRSSHNC
jgi:hypothetical protein